MSETVLSTQVLLRNGTLETWEKTTKPLGKGEMAVVYCPAENGNSVITRLKVGDGTTLFKDLPYAGMDVSDIPMASSTESGLLSADDYEKLSNIEKEADKSTITTVKVNNDTLEIDENRAVNISVPDGALAQLDSVGYADLDSDLQGRITTLETNGHAHTNATVLDSITSDDITAWDAKLDKLSMNTSTAGDFVKLASDGTLVDAGVNANSFDAAGAASTAESNVVGAQTDTKEALTLYGIKAYVDDKTTNIASTSALDDKADLVTKATAGNLAGLNSAGNLTDSGIIADNVVTSITVDGVSVVSNHAAAITLPTIVDYTISKASTAATGYLATYQLMAGKTAVGDAINIPKDYLVKGAEVLIATDENADIVGVKAGDKYIDFIVNTVNDDGDDTHIYLAVNDIVKPYGVDNPTDSLITLSLSSDNQFSATIDLSDYATTTALSNKVDKETDKRLMDNEEANKLSAIEENAQVNVIESISGVTTSVENKVAKITAISTDLLTDGINMLVLDGGSASDLVVVTSD
jgi:hypothetical protein